MGPKGKGVKGKPSKQAKGRKKKEGEEEVEEENERAISPQPPGGGGTSILKVSGTCRWQGYDFCSHRY